MVHIRTYSLDGPGKKTLERAVEIQTRIAQMTENNVGGYGMNDHEIARILGISDRTVFRYRHANNVPDWRGIYPKKPDAQA